jgi:ankyrin repeat protein
MSRPPIRSGSGAGTFFLPTYLLNAATLKPSFFAACRIENELIGNIVPDSLSDVKHSSENNHVMATESLELLLANNAKIEARDNEALKVLLKSGVNIEAIDAKRATPLIRAVIGGYTELVRLL